ncbi:MAG: hypothetical protein N2049_04015 [Anaerolineales bacterium]|nr:hypothetical protein [Anaerolineales bacterium]MCX7608368.1 hypothetical protein [Anaerolineales bacterium]MDW8226964.1 hypothetical protein [Anaerolineales bacterium]
MQLRVHALLPYEICHYADGKTLITSRYHWIYVQHGVDRYCLRLPERAWLRPFGLLRLTRRLARLDKCNVVPVEGGLVIIRQGRVYRYDAAHRRLQEVLKLRNCRNVLHQSIAVLEGRQLYFGEYGRNAERREVPVYRSLDGGQTWETVFCFPRGKIKHVHGCYYDPYEDKIWVLTGDYADENYLLCADRDFRQVEWIGDGQQRYRTCNLFFRPESVDWVMDSHLEPSYHICLDRRTRRIEIKQMFPGPVWYVKTLEDGWYLAATAQEIGPGVLDRYAHLMVSRDLETWEELARFEHDGWPKKLFKFGVIGFADGPQTSQEFYLFAEALKGFDGKTARCALG